MNKIIILYRILIFKNIFLITNNFVFFCMANQHLFLSNIQDSPLTLIYIKLIVLYLVFIIAVLLSLPSIVCKLSQNNHDNQYLIGKAFLKELTLPQIYSILLHIIISLNLLYLINYLNHKHKIIHPSYV